MECRARLQGGFGVMFVVFVVVLLISGNQVNASSELKCYQCEKNSNANCDESDLKPCATFNDRCVTHISKNLRDGFRIKRECGLAPCTFEDDMVQKGLGFQCDQSKPDFSCVFCCKDDGCNKNGNESSMKPNKMLYLTIIVYVLILCLLNVARDFIPPYVQPLNKK